MFTKSSQAMQSSLPRRRASNRPIREAGVEDGGREMAGRRPPHLILYAVRARSIVGSSAKETSNLSRCHNVQEGRRSSRPGAHQHILAWPHKTLKKSAAIRSPGMAQKGEESSRISRIARLGAIRYCRLRRAASRATPRAR